MTMPKNRKLSTQPNRYNENEITAATALTRLSSTIDPSSSNHSPKDHSGLTFEEYKNPSLGFTQQHKVTSKLHERVPLTQVHEVNSWLLESLAKQLETCIFPTAKMMCIDPNTVKRMLDNEFRKAYGLGVETTVLDPDIRRDGQQDMVVQSAEAGMRVEQQEETPEQSEHRSGDEEYETVSSAATIDRDNIYTPETSKKQRSKPRFSGKASNNTRKSLDHHQGPPKTSGKQKCTDFRMISGQECTSFGEPIKRSTRALMKSDLRIRRHGNNVCFRNVSESRKKAFRYHAKQYKQRCDSFVITLSSKIAAVRWQELECISSIQAYVEKIEGQGRHDERNDGDKRGQKGCMNAVKLI